MTNHVPKSLNFQFTPKQGHEFAEARHMRRLLAKAKWDEVTEDTAVDIYEMLQGDWEADAVPIGRCIVVGAKKLGGDVVINELIDRLGVKLEIPPQRLQLLVDAFRVVELCGDALARRMPGCPFPILVRLSKIAKADVMPWRRKAAILKVADAIARKASKAQHIDSLIDRALTNEVAKSKLALPVIPTWHLPSATKIDKKAA